MTAVEAQRGRLFDDEVVDVALVALREQLVAQQKSTTMQQLDSVCVLVADISGFTSMSEFVDAEEVQDTVNAIWRQIDRVINRWGGRVDQHVGDGIIALFGLPVPVANDAVRAVLAALDMLTEMVLFNEGVGDERPITGAFRPRAMQIRVGVHIGSVLIGQVGSAVGQTAVGETITIANQIEQVAPVGSVLVSEAVHELISPFFETEIYYGSRAADRTQILLPFATFRVHTPLRHAFAQTPEGIGTLEYRFVGRSDELNQLQMGLQLSLDNNMAQLVTVGGAAGVGKSRLAYEFERLLTLLPEELVILKGRPPQTPDAPAYALIRRVLENYLDIYAANTPGVVKRKLAVRLMERFYLDEAEVERLLPTLELFLGYRWVAAEHGAVRSDGFDAVIYLFQRLLARGTAVVLLLEDFHLADEGSYDLIDYLFQVCHDAPLFVLCLAQPGLFDKRPSWRVLDTPGRKEMALMPLSLIDSRHLLVEMLQRVEGMPIRLVEVLSNNAVGNPRDLEELLSLFGQQGVLDQSAVRWVVNMGRLLDLPSPPTVTNLMAGLLEQLPDDWRMFLQKAAVLGTVFWYEALLEVGQFIPETERVLRELIAARWLVVRTPAYLPGTLELAFRYDGLQQVVYRSIPLEDAQLYHAQMAVWLQGQPFVPTPRFLGFVAEQWEWANEQRQAVNWWRQAGWLATEDNALETAVFYYERALRLLREEVTVEIQPMRITILLEVGRVLQKQGRFLQAIEALTQAEVVAAQVADKALLLQIQLQLHMAYLHCAQGPAAVAAAKRAETTARAGLTKEEFMLTVAAQGWGYVAQGQLVAARPIARDLFTYLHENGVGLAATFARAFLALFALELGRFQQATTMAQQALTVFQQREQLLWLGMMMAVNGRIALEQWQLPAAKTHYEQLLHFARNGSFHYLSIIALNRLGQIAAYENRFAEAQNYYYRAVALAEKSLQNTQLVQLANYLGLLYLHQALNRPRSVRDMALMEGQLQEAYRWFERAIQMARSLDNKRELARAQSGLAQLFLDDHLLEEAQAQAETAVQLMEQQLKTDHSVATRLVAAGAWRVLGLVLAKAPQKKMDTAVIGEIVTADSCFQKSVALCEQAGRMADLERAWAWAGWANYLYHHDQLEQSQQLAEQAQTLLQSLGIRQEIVSLSAILAAAE